MNACIRNANASTPNVAVVPSANGNCGDPGVLGVALLKPYRLLSARTSISLNGTAFGPVLPDAHAAISGCGKRRKARVAAECRLRWLGIATNPVASLTKSSAEVGHGSAVMCFEVGRLLCGGQL